jgi:hypothetical protein
MTSVRRIVSLPTVMVSRGSSLARPVASAVDAPLATPAVVPVAAVAKLAMLAPVTDASRTGDLTMSPFTKPDRCSTCDAYAFTRVFTVALARVLVSASDTVGVHGTPGCTTVATLSRSTFTMSRFSPATSLLDRRVDARAVVCADGDASNHRRGVGDCSVVALSL